MKEAVAPMPSTEPSPIIVYNGAQKVEVTFSGASFTMTTTNSSGNNTRTILKVSYDTSNELVTYAPIDTTPYSINYASYSNTPVSAFGGTGAVASGGKSGTYSHPSGSGSLQYLESSSDTAGYLNSIYAKHKVILQGGGGGGGCQVASPGGGIPKTICPPAVPQWVNLGLGLIGIIAGVVGFLAVGVLAFAAGIIALACGVILLFSTM